MASCKLILNNKGDRNHLSPYFSFPEIKLITNINSRFIGCNPLKPIPLGGGEEVAILVNLAVNVLTFFSNDNFFCVFSYNIKNFCFLVIFIYKNYNHNVPFHICTLNKK